MIFRQLKYVIRRFVFRSDSLLAPTSHYGMQLRVKTEDVIGRHLYKYGAHDPDRTSFLMGFLKLEEDDVILDVGANIGWYSLIIDRLAGNLNVDVFAFEPEPTNFGLLEENVARNGATHVTTIQRAIAEETGTRTLHLFGKSNRGRHSLLPIHAGVSITVNTLSVDDFWESRQLGMRVPRLIKIDIEGYELMALKGASSVLGRCPLVMLEYSPIYMRAASLDPAELVALMTARGFVAHTLAEEHLEPIETTQLLTTDRHMDLFWTR